MISSYFWARTLVPIYLLLGSFPRPSAFMDAHSGQSLSVYKHTTSTPIDSSASISIVSRNMNLVLPYFCHRQSEPIRHGTRLLVVSPEWCFSTMSSSSPSDIKRYWERISTLRSPAVIYILGRWRRRRIGLPPFLI